VLTQPVSESIGEFFLTCYEILILEGVFFKVEEHGFAVEAFD